MRFLLMGYTPTWRKLRAIVHNKLLTPRASEGFKPSQEFEAKQLVHDLYARNGDQKSFYTAVRRHVPKNCTLLHQKHQSPNFYQVLNISDDDIHLRPKGA